MALKQYEIAFKLAAKMSGDFPKSFKNASDAVEKLGDLGRGSFFRTC